MKWSRDANKVVKKSYLKSDPVNEKGIPIRGYRKRILKVWHESGSSESTEQRVCVRQGPLGKTVGCQRL